MAVVPAPSSAVAGGNSSGSEIEKLVGGNNSGVDLLEDEISCPDAPRPRREVG